MADLELSFSTRGELEGAKQYAAELDRQIGKMKAMGQDASDLTAKLGRLNTAIEQSAKKLSDMERPSAEVRDALSAEARAANEAAHSTETKVVAMNKAVVAAAALTAAYATLKKSIGEFAETQEAVTSLDAALAQHGNLTEEVRQKYQSLAGEMQTTTAIADEEWIKVLATLTKFGATPEGIEGAAAAVKNLAGFMGGDLTSAATMVGKALQGKFETLTRLGLKVDDTKTKSENLQSIFEQLAQRGGGQLEARANTLSGQFAGLRVATGDVFEGIGNLIDRTHVLTMATEIVTGVMKGFTILLPETVAQNDALRNKSAAAAVELKKQAEAQAALAAATEAAVKALEAENKAIDRQRQLNQTVGDARTQEQLALIDLAEHSGEISSEEANLRRSKVRSSAEVNKLTDDRLSLMLKEDALKKALQGVTDPKQRSPIEGQLADVRSALGGNLEQLRVAQVTGRSDVSGAEAAIRRAEQKRIKDQEEERLQQARDDEREVQQQVQRLTQGTLGAGESFRQTSDAVAVFAEGVVRENIQLKRRLTVLESRMNAAR